jgi:hypothetical protein
MVSAFVVLPLFISQRRKILRFDTFRFPTRAGSLAKPHPPNDLGSVACDRVRAVRRIGGLEAFFRKATRPRSRSPSPQGKPIA